VTTDNRRAGAASLDVLSCLEIATARAPFLEFCVDIRIAYAAISRALVKILELNGAIQAFVPSRLVAQHDFTSMF